MRRINTFAIVIPALLFFFACTKNVDVPPTFSPVGYWEGPLFSGIIVGILNRPDGSSRVYLVQGGDTTSTFTSMEGRYSVREDIFQANYVDSAGVNYINIETARTTARSMNGELFLHMSNVNQNTSTAFSFEVIKR